MASGACCGHDHDCDAEDCAPQWSLYKYVDTAQVTCLNEALAGSCRNVFKPWDKRTEPTIPPLQSNEDDCELLLHIPFTGDVKLSSICVVGGVDGTAPSKMRAFINRDDLDFATVESLSPVQEWELADNLHGHLEYPTKVTRFINVHSLTLHFPECFDGDVMQLNFVGLKGEYKEAKRQAVTAVYESRALPEDHKVGGETHMNKFIN